MSTQYFLSPGNPTPFGYDVSTQGDLIAAAVLAGWTDITSTWPPAPTPLTVAQQVAAIPSVALWKIKIVLAGQAGAETGKTLLDDANTVVANASVHAQIAWANAADVQRSSPTLATLSSALSLSSAEVDTLYLAESQVSI